MGITPTVIFKVLKSKYAHYAILITSLLIAVKSCSKNDTESQRQKSNYENLNREHSKLTKTYTLTKKELTTRQRSTVKRVADSAEVKQKQITKVHTITTTRVIRDTVIDTAFVTQLKPCLTKELLLTHSYGCDSVSLRIDTTGVQTWFIQDSTKVLTAAYWTRKKWFWKFKKPKKYYEVQVFDDCGGKVIFNEQLKIQKR